MEDNNAHIVPLGYPSLGQAPIRRGRKFALTQRHFCCQLTDTSWNGDPGRKALYKANLLNSKKHDLFSGRDHLRWPL